MSPCPESAATALRGCLRKALRVFLPGDEVDVNGTRGVIVKIHEDRTGTVAFHGEAPAGVEQREAAAPEHHPPHVQAVEVQAGLLVDVVTFHFSDGNRRSFGEPGGAFAGRFTLEEGEVIVRVTGSCGDSLDSIQFHTCSGRASQVFGNAGNGVAFNFTSPPGQSVVGLHRGAGRCAAIRSLECARQGTARFAGQRVEIRGLTSSEGRALNGRQGVIQQDACAPGRVPVLLDGYVTIKAIRVDHVVAASSMASHTARVLLRDCDLLTPRGRLSRRKMRCRNFDVLSWRGSCHMRADGHASANGQRVRPVRREGVHHVMPIASSDVIPEGVRVTGVTMHVCGMDQGWGNSGDSGVVLYVVRATVDAGLGDAAREEEPFFKVTYDHHRHPSRQHTVSSNALFGAAPQAGDRLEAVLHVPSYPGWSGDVEQVTVTIHCVEEEEELLPGELLEGWEGSASQAFDHLWQGLGDDSNLAIDLSHLSIQGQIRQKVWLPPSGITTESDPGPVAARLRDLCHERNFAPPTGATQLLQKLDANTPTGGAPQDPQRRLARYWSLRALVHRTIDGLRDKADLLEAVCLHYADAEGHCVYRWEREISNMHDLVTGAASGSDALAAEDLVLKVLCTARRQIAEAALYRAKGATTNSDMHFESYFYGSIHFGLPEQVEAARDPNRLNYNSLNILRPADIQKSLMEEYTPAVVRKVVREKMLESSAPGSQAMREKLVDWLRANVPYGFQKLGANSSQQEAWVYEVCHDESFRLRDAALNFLLCRMHVLQPVQLCGLDGDPSEVAPPWPPPRIAPASAGAHSEGPWRCVVQ